MTTQTADHATRPFIDYAADIAAALGDGWTAEADADEYVSNRANRASLIHPDGRRLHLHRGGWRLEGRVRISPDWGDLRGYSRDDYDGGRWTNRANLEATVSAATAPAKAAKDIARRIVAPYTELRAELQAAKAEDERNRAAMVALAGDLAAVAGPLVHFHKPGRDRKPSGALALSAASGLYGDVEVSYGGESVRIDVRGLTPDDARAILALLRARRTGREG
jgi:hypothetical protein